MEAGKVSLHVESKVTEIEFFVQSFGDRLVKLEVEVEKVRAMTYKHREEMDKKLDEVERLHGAQIGTLKDMFHALDKRITVIATKAAVIGMIGAGVLATIGAKIVEAFF